MKRGDIVMAVLSGDYGKPRPAVIIQSDHLGETDSILVCLMTSDQHDAPAYRLPIFPEVSTGLRIESDVMVDKIMAAHRSRIRSVIGRLPQDALNELDRRLAFVIGLGG